jgi:hypothetical protein
MATPNQATSLLEVKEPKRKPFNHSTAVAHSCHECSEVFLCVPEKGQCTAIVHMYASKEYRPHLGPQRFCSQTCINSFIDDLPYPDRVIYTNTRHFGEWDAPVKVVTISLGDNDGTYGKIKPKRRRVEERWTCKEIDCVCLEKNCWPEM